MNPGEQDPSLQAGAEETQSQTEGDGSQQRSATSGAAGRDSYAIAGNNVSGSTRRGDVVGGNKSEQKNFNFGAVALLIGLAIGASLLFFIGKTVVEKVGGAIASSQTASITKDSTCAEYLQQDQPTRDAAIKRVGLELHVRGVGSPLMLPEVDYECGNSPSTKFGTVVGRQKGY